MKCPQCGQPNSRVIDSRPSDEGTSLRRRRSCDSCGYRFTTHERVQQTPLMVVKKDGRREEFSPEKLRGGIAKACDKRSVSTDQINSLVQTLEAELRLESSSEIGAERIGELVMERLYHLDQVAYVRFASVYQRFDDVRRFAQLLERMSRRNRNRSPKKLRYAETGDLLHRAETAAGPILSGPIPEAEIATEVDSSETDTSPAVVRPLAEVEDSTERSVHHV